MITHAEKKPNHKNRSGSCHESTTQLADNRPLSTALGTLQNVAETSPQTNHLQTMQNMVSSNSKINDVAIAIQRVVKQWEGGKTNPEGGKEGQWYSSEVEKWFENEKAAKFADRMALRNKKRQQARDKRKGTRREPKVSGAASAAAPKEKKEALPELEPEEKLERERLSGQIVIRLNSEREKSKPEPERPVETPVFTGEIKKTLGLRGARFTPKQIFQATLDIPLDELRELYERASYKQTQWPLRNKFIQHDGPYSTYEPSEDYSFDKAYKVTQQEIAFWNSFLDRDIVLGNDHMIAEMKAKIKVIQHKLAEKNPAIDKLLSRVNVSSKLKAERMKLSNTVVGAGHGQALKEGKGNEIAERTTEGRQWQEADKFMMSQVAGGNIGEIPSTIPELSPEFILKINQLESSGKGLVNSQAAGELRYSSIALGGKGEDSHNLRLVPPSELAHSLAGLVNGVNEQLTHIRTPEDIWEIVPITARFYTDFIAIHPFPDGNGRTARKVVDFLLLSYGLPPAQFDNTTKNFGAGIPDTPGPLKIERPFDDLTGVQNVMTAVMKSLETLLRE